MLLQVMIQVTELTKPGSIRRMKMDQKQFVPYQGQNIDNYPLEQQTILQERMTKQNWPGVCDVNYTKFGRGLMTTCSIAKDDILLDYCGKRINGITSDEYLVENPDSSEYLYQVTSKFLIDASSETCPNHVGIRCLGRLINHGNKKAANLVSKHVFFGSYQYLIFIASRDIKAFEQIFFDYGDVVARRQFRG